QEALYLDALFKFRKGNHASSRIKLGEKVSLNIAVAGETWGRIEATAVWANREVRKDPDLPAGIFLRSMSSDKDFDRRINALG
ncbi:MAG: hypothetical protein R6V39_08025, partial [Desulfovibrionales bacterium]